MSDHSLSSWTCNHLLRKFVHPHEVTWWHFAFEVNSRHAPWRHALVPCFLFMFHSRSFWRKKTYSQRQNIWICCRSQGRNVQTMPSVTWPDKSSLILWKSTIEIGNVKLWEDHKRGTTHNSTTVREPIELLVLELFKMWRNWNRNLLF